MSRRKSSYNMYEAKTHFSELVETVTSGQEVILMNRGKPVAKVVPLIEAPVHKKLGFLKSKIVFKPGWDKPLEDFDGYLT